MKTLITILLVAAIAVSCKSKTPQYSYRIEGLVLVSGRQQPAIWVTDHFNVKNDTVIITNSDSSSWRIAPPYNIKRNGRTIRRVCLAQ